MLRNILAAVFGSSSSKSESATPTQQREETPVIQSEPEPTFLFPDTLTEWRVALQQLRQEHTTQDANHEAKLSQLTSQRMELQQSMPTGTDAPSELERRRITRELERIQGWTRLEYDRYCTQKRGRKSVAGLTEEFRQTERELVAHEGHILAQSLYECYPPSKLYKEERRLVRLEDGRHFVILLIHRAAMRDTGGKLEPTGEYQPHCVKWATDSLAQFNDEELQVVATHG